MIVLSGAVVDRDDDRRDLRKLLVSDPREGTSSVLLESTVLGYLSSSLLFRSSNQIRRDMGGYGWLRACYVTTAVKNRGDDAV